MISRKNNGLTSAEAQERLKRFGYNELTDKKSNSIFQLIIGIFKEPMFILLLICAGLYTILGDYKEGMILLSSTVLIIFITVYQHQKTEKALEMLQKLSSPRVIVRRDGKESRIPGREVVPGDLILLHEGDRIPADAELFLNDQLVIDESVLTGESVAVSRSEGKVFSGTLVVRGSSEAIVLNTGEKTEFGKIGESLKGITQEQTRLQKEMTSLIKRLFLIGGVISILVVLTFYLTRGNFLQSLLNGLASSMAILPEEFPVVLTVFLALGAWRMSKKNVLTRKPSAIETLGAATVLCTDKTGTLTQNKMRIVRITNGERSFLTEDSDPINTKILQYGALASDPRSIDPMDVAFQAFQSESSMEFIKEFPLSKDHLMITRVFKKEDQYHIFVKGAPESVLKCCPSVSEELHNQLNEKITKYADKGMRVLAIGGCITSDLPERIEDIQFNFEGLVSFEDPIMSEVPKAVEECRTAGIRVVMITGDHPATALNIARQIGISEPTVLTGQDLNNMSEEQLQKDITSVTVFARVIPEQKLRIVKALQSNNEVVVMTGDGVNDAPALKAADIGIAMGMKGTDVAREAASLVLLDDNFSSIVAAIKRGRKIFDNLQKAMSYIIAVHIPIIGLVLTPAFFPEMPLILLPIHIIFMELIIDPICSIAFEAEEEEKGIMQRPPRNPSHSFFSNQRILRSVGSGLFLFVIVMIVHYVSSLEGHTEDEIRAISFTTLIIGNIFLIISYLSQTRSIFHIFTERNPVLLIILSVSSLVLFVTISVQSVQHLFKFHNPGYSHFLISIGLSALMLIILEFVKIIRLKKLQKQNVV
jgi:Ca2+-transporting ATPase